MRVASVPDEQFNPTRTLLLEYQYALAIRQAYGIIFRRLSNEAVKSATHVSVTEQHRGTKRKLKTFKEQTIYTIPEEYLERASIILNGLSDLIYPIVAAYIADAYHRGNFSVAQLIGLPFLPYNLRIRRLLIGEAETDMDKFTADLTFQIRKTILTGMEEGQALPTIVGNMAQTMKMVSWKAEQIARTEIIKTHATAVRQTIRDSKVTPYYKWILARERIDPHGRHYPCPKCEQYRGKIFRVDDPNAPTPAKDTHPNCRCGIVAYSPDWEAMRRGEWPLKKQEEE